MVICCFIVFFLEESLCEQDSLIETLVLYLCSAEDFRYGVPNVPHSVPNNNIFTREILPNVDEGRFKQFMRMNWQTFDFIVNLIQYDEVFTSLRSDLQLPVKVQLIIVLYRPGSYGEESSVVKTASFFGVGDGGTIIRATFRVFKTYLYWSDLEERVSIVQKTLDELPFCIGYVNGSDLSLAEKPVEDAESYYSRKQRYSIKMQAVCDQRKLIRHLVVGWPGSVHDSRVFQNCPLYTKPDLFLTGDQWIAADSAYKLSEQAITPFQSNSTDLTRTARNEFNRTFSRYRVRIGQCFGMLKERFNSLKDVKIMGKNAKSLSVVCDWVFVCAVLRNIIILSGHDDIMDCGIPP